MVAAPVPLIIMPMGDSVTAGGGTAVGGGPPPGAYRAPLYTSLTAAGYGIQYVGDQTFNGGGGLPANQVNHEGIGGYGIITIGGSQTNPGMLDYIQAHATLTTYQPNLICLMLGANNIYVAAPANIGPAAAYVNLKTMIQYIFNTLPSVKIIMGTITANSSDLGIPTSNPNAVSEEGYYNFLLLNNLLTDIPNPNLFVADVNGAMNGFAGGVASLIGPDGLHPNVQGNVVIASAFDAKIKSIYTVGAAKTRVVVPVTGTVTKGTWVQNQRLNVAAMPHGFINYDYILPPNYSASGSVIWPVLFYGHENTEGTNNTNLTYPGGSILFGSSIGTNLSPDTVFNTVNFRTAFSPIVVIPYCDQTDGLGGTGENFGGYQDTPNSGGNEKGINALAQFFIANFAADPTRMYCTGDSLGAIGTVAWMVDNNAYNGLNRIWAGGMAFSDNLFRPASVPNSQVFTAMQAVPLLAISTPNDNDPTIYDQPAWRAYTGNSNYPTPANYTASGMAGIRAGSTSFYYINTTTGVPWTTYRQINADGGQGTAAYTWLFSQISGASAPAVITPASVVAFLNSITGKHAVSGYFLDRGPSTPADNVFSSTGKHIGLIGGDYWFIGQSNAPATTTINPVFKAQWAAGGLVTLINSMPNPATGGGSNDLNFSSQNASDISNNNGNSTNATYRTMLDSIAAGLQDLENSGVIVIYRPFHEMNGSWFWWGAANMSAAQFHALWIYTYNYLVTTKGLSNLVWDYSPNTGFAVGGRSLLDTYPGDAFVDMTGQDLYTNNLGADALSTYNALLALVPNKPTALNEFGSGSPSSGNTGYDERSLISDLKNTVPKMVFWQQWQDGNGGGTGWGYDLVQNSALALADPWVLNRGDFTVLAGGGGTGFTPSPNNTTVLAGSSALITDSVGNLWGINSSAQVVKNAVADTTTSSVVEIAYVNSVVWHKNSSGNWFSYTGSGWAAGANPLPGSSPSGTVITVGNGGSITDSAFNVWTISGSGTGGQVTLNGTIDTGSNFIIEMAYVNGQVWTEDGTNTWYPTFGIGNYGAGTPTSPLTNVPGGLSYIAPFKAAGMRVITYIKQQSPAGFTTGLASLRAEQAARQDIFIYEGCQEPDTAVIVGTPETLASAASFQQTVWAAGLADGKPVIQTSFGVLADYGTSGNLAAFATYGNAHTYPGNVPGNAGTAPGLMTSVNTAALLTTPNAGVAHTEYGWANDHNAQLAIASYVLNFAMSSFFDFNNPYCIVNGLYDDATGQWGLFNTDQTPRLAATALDNLYTLLQDNGASPLGFGPGKLNVSFSGLPASPSGAHMGGQVGVLQKSDGSFFVMLRNEQTLTGPDPNHTAIVVAPVSVVMTLGTLATSIAVFDPLIGITAVQSAANTSSLTISLPAHPILVKIVRP